MRLDAELGPMGVQVVRIGPRSSARRGHPRAARTGIAGERLETDGKGEGLPADANDTPAGKANNRRVEFVP